MRQLRRERVGLGAHEQARAKARGERARVELGLLRVVRGERQRHARGEQRGEGGRPAAVQVVQARVEREREVGRARAPRQRVGLSK